MTAIGRMETCPDSTQSGHYKNGSSSTPLISNMGSHASSLYKKKISSHYMAMEN
jgi:hypothetical protein